MTYEKAKELCKTTLFESEEQEKYVLKALELQIAKQPVCKNMGEQIADMNCPSCGERIVSVINGEFCAGREKEFCDKCGQKIAWNKSGRNKEDV